MSLASTKLLWMAAIGILLSVVSAIDLHAQNRRGTATVPIDSYFAGFGPFYQGDYERAAEVFASANRSGVRSTEGRWVDSICYSTMLGECNYHMGNHAEAKNHFDTALLLFIQHSAWMLRFNPDSLVAISPTSNDQRSSVTWGATTRNTLIGNFPEVLPIFQGNTNAQNQQVAQTGGVLRAPQYVPVRAAEVARCIALALYRRQEILGPVSQHDAMTAQLEGILQRRPAPPNHWLGVWVDVQHGIALAANGKGEEAIQTLQRSLTVAGQYDHHLTALALLQLGRLALQQQNYDAAEQYFLEASYAATAFNQYQQVEDAFKGLAQVYLVQKPGQVPAPFVGVTQWKELRRLDSLRAELSLSLAEFQAYAGNTSAATASLEEARRSMNRRSMSRGLAGIRFGYLSALVNFQNGNAAAGNADLRSAITLNRNASKRLFQIAVTSNLFVANTITERTAQLLFDQLLREPTDADWVVDPFETLTVLVTPNPTAMEHWFNTAILRKQPELALELADRIRRMRFFATLPLGGRVLALRWILEAPESSLGTQARLQRQDLLAKFPEVETLRQQAHTLRDELRQIDLQPADSDKDSLVKQRRLTEQLVSISDQLELRLSALALRRTPSQFLFPPLRSTSEVREQLDDTQLVLSFFSTSRAVHAFMFTKKNYVHWTLDDPRAIHRNLTSLLREVGLVKRDAPVQSKTLDDPQWKTTAEELLTMFIPTLKAGFWSNYSELIVIPDGVLWYVPFEALYTDDGLGAGNMVPLAEVIAVRYAPTAGLVVPMKAARPRPQNTAIIAGRLFNSDRADVTQKHFEQLQGAFTSPARIDRVPVGPSSMLAKAWDQLGGLDDIEDANRGGTWDWSPAQVDRSKTGSDLGSWLRLPLSGPDVVYLPGYHTSAEDVLKSEGNGNEIFLTSLGLMATGTETLVLSRWHSGGSASVSIIEAMARRIADRPASEAWREAIAEVRQRTLEPETEPRLKGTPGGAAPTLDHPYFWADLMLIDTGIRPTAAGP